MLRKARIILSVVIFGLITFYFLDFAEILPNSFHRLAHIQFVPALMSLSFIILVVLVLITLLLGRIYCSTICPMGIFQDIVTWISKKTAKKKKRFRDSFSFRIYGHFRSARSLQRFRTYDGQCV